MTSMIGTLALALQCLQPVSTPHENVGSGTRTMAVACIQPVADSTRATFRFDSDTVSTALPWSLRVDERRSTPLPLNPARRELLRDSVPRRGNSVVHSDAYYTRLTIHRRLGYGMLPLFALSYFSGDQLMKSGPDAPGWARTLHGPSATGVGILFGANAITGSWNLWEGRHDTQGQTRRILHSALFMVASGGFVYAGSVLADEAETSGTKRSQHRDVNLWSMGVATASWLIMLIPHQ